MIRFTFFSKVSSLVIKVVKKSIVGSGSHRENFVGLCGYMPKKYKFV